MVQVFGSADKIAGPEASDALRERMIRAFPSRVLWVFGKEDVVTLEQSGYPPTSSWPAPTRPRWPRCSAPTSTSAAR
jgi:hypothetical protein